MIEHHSVGPERKATGNVFFAFLNDRTMPSMQQVIADHVNPGGEIWTDGLSSYGWLDDDERWIHCKCIHSRGEFAWTRADGVRISTNAVEGLHGRTKRMLREYHAVCVKRDEYGPYLGELMFRMRFLSARTIGKDREWRRRAFWEVLKAFCVLFNLSSEVSQEDYFGREIQPDRPYLSSINLLRMLILRLPWFFLTTGSANGKCSSIAMPTKSQSASEVSPAAMVVADPGFHKSLLMLFLFLHRHIAL